MSQISLEGLPDAIRSIGRPNFYECMSAYLRACMPFDNIVVIVFNGTGVPSVEHKKTYGPDVFRYIDSDYLTGAYVLDPVYHFHLDRKKSGIYGLLDIAPDQFRRSRYYEWYYGRIGIKDEISVIQTIGTDTTVTISMGKDGTSGDLFPAKAENSLRAHEAVIMALLDMHLSKSMPFPSPDQSKSSLAEHLMQAMRERMHVTLSRRQAEVALLILRGHSSPSIALNLHISPQTVKVFRKQLYKRCNLSSQAELFATLMPMLEDLMAVSGRDTKWCGL